MPTDDMKLAMLMRAFLSRPERWHIEEYTDPASYRTAYRLHINGSIETDGSFIEAVDRA